MKLDAGMVGAGQTTATETACGHPKVPTILLDGDVGGDFEAPKSECFD